MRLCTQRDELANAAESAASDVRSLMARLRRKMAAPYGDGTRSNMVNAETDVLPALYDIVLELETTLERTRYH